MEETRPGNTAVMQPEGYVLVTLRGKQDFMTMDKLAKDCIEIAGEIKAEGKPLIGLVDFSQDPGFDTGTNKAVMKALEQIPYDRIAMYGKNALLSEVTKAVIAALGKSNRTKVFGTREEALAWLLMRDPVHGYED